MIKSSCLMMETIVVYTEAGTKCVLRCKDN